MEMALRTALMIAVAASTIVECSCDTRVVTPAPKTIVSATENPTLPAGVAPRLQSEQLEEHTATSPLLGLGSPLRTKWTTFARGDRHYIQNIRVVTESPVNPRVSIDFGLSDLFDDERTQYTVFATTWINRKGALVHDYFRVQADGRQEFLGSYCD